MVFSSFIFVVVYLPIVASIFFLVAQNQRKRAAEFWLIFASLVFYGWWDPRYVSLLLASIAFNFLCAARITSRESQPAARKLTLILAISLNLLCLFYFKYFNFFVTAVSASIGIDMHFEKILLPIGISFFTFTQIAFLVDAYVGKAREPDSLNYGLFVTYFPHLIAGPVLHHSEMMPQFADRETYRLLPSNLSLGMIYFLIGIIKKVCFADSISPFADRVFGGHSSLSFIGAWEGVLAYTLQIYFDFSGYSDMAIGLSGIFNVELPLNFNSPYKAKDIIDFWRRWHMTLSRFLRDYLYVPLGGNRKGVVARFRNLFITMLLGGLWHGANWTFVVWGGIHGAYLIVNHGFRAFVVRAGNPLVFQSKIFGWISWIVTFLSVVVAWVFFRAPDMRRALQILTSMGGGNGLESNNPRFDIPAGVLPAMGSLPSLWIVALCLIAWFAPNSQQMMSIVRGSRKFHSVTSSYMGNTAVICGCWLLVVFCVSINEVRSAGSPFIYFNF